MHRRWLIPGLVVVVGLLAACGSDGGSDASTSPSTEATPSGAASVAGEPCVAVSEPLPAGAPEVPVQAGPPPTELVVEDLVAGDGAETTASSTVVADYVGVSCSTGRIFDSSYSRGEPATFPLGGVIPGWQQGLVGMKVGGSRLLGIPPDLAYADAPPPGSGIAPGETLWFVVDLRDVQG